VELWGIFACGDGEKGGDEVEMIEQCGRGGETEVHHAGGHAITKVRDMSNELFDLFAQHGLGNIHIAGLH
jgi:hypothetical protein